MSHLIMQDTTGIPEIAAKLRDDAKAIIITNTGNARAEKIHVALVPVNIEFDISSLEVDSSYEFSLNSMVENIKFTITYQNENGRLFSSSSKLSAFGEEPDLLKPMIPIFKWKK
jgi:arginyl-tRNA synthetase